MKIETPLIEELPQFLWEIREYKAILGTAYTDKQGIFGDFVNKLWSEIEKGADNQVAEYADKDGIYTLEQRYKLKGGTITTAKELEERRTRLLNRMSLRPPYTYKKIKEQIETIIDGENVIIDYSPGSHSLTVKLPAVTDTIEDEVGKTLRRMIPASITYSITTESSWGMYDGTTWEDAKSKTWDEMKG